MNNEERNSRLDLLHELISEKRQGTVLYDRYLTQNREYMPGTQLFMKEAHFLMAVEPGDGKKMSDLAGILGVTQGAVSQTADRLEKKGFLKRSRAKNDRRQIVARLTPQGEKFYHYHMEYDRIQYGAMLEQLKGYSDEELKQFIGYERTMAAIFRFACENTDLSQELSSRIAENQKQNPSGLPEAEEAAD